MGEKGVESRHRFSPIKLKMRREELGMTVNEVLARLWAMGHTKASPQLMNYYESGAHTPGTEYALSLAEIYECTVADFCDQEVVDDRANRR